MDDIEHKILRPIWQDQRIHYALNYASIGCPNIQAHAFATTNTKELLNLAARQYIKHSRGIAIKNGKLHISIFAIDTKKISVVMSIGLSNILVSAPKHHYLDC